MRQDRGRACLALQRIKDCEIVGVCDREPLMARQLYERFPVKRYFSDLTELLSDARPDVVHVTTPPESHFDIAKLCLEWGMPRLCGKAIHALRGRCPNTNCTRQ